MRIRLAVAGLATGLLIGGCSTYGVLPDTTKLPQPVLSGTDRQDTVKTMQETAQNHGAEAAKKIEGAR
jgi:ABC-type glycerol-3-phosphate transport system substrate-binding protein